MTLRTNPPSSSHLPPKRRFGRRWARLTALTLISATLALSACKRQADSPQDGVSALRDEARDSRDQELVSEWLLSELLSPGGQAAQARAARKRLDELKATGLLAEFGRALDDAYHGKSKRVADAYLRTVVAARDSEDPRAPLLAWYAAHRAFEHRGESPGFLKRWHKAIDDLLERPGRIGWRAYGSLLDLWTAEAWESARADLNEIVATRLGCVKSARLAGPFGSDSPADLDRKFGAEAPGPWPARWALEPGRSEAPHVLDVERTGCDFEADEPVNTGTFYAETFVTVTEPQDVVLTASGATRIWVDDHLVLDRDVRTWGIWPKFGVALRLEPGRHRVLARLASPNTNLRLVGLDGRPATFETDDRASSGYTLTPPTVLADPNVLMRYVRDGRVIDPPDDVSRFVAAQLAAIEGEADVASVLSEPLVKEPEKSTGVALLASADFVEADPIFDRSQTQDLMHELHTRAAEHDPALWQARLSTALWEANQRGPIAAVDPLEQLVRQFPEVPALRYSLVRSYGSLGWTPEVKRAARELVKQFPDSTDAIEIGIDLYDSEGAHDKADALLARLVKIQPDTEVPLQRALERRDYQAALAELRRLGNRRPDRKDLAERTYDVLVRAGNPEDVWKKLEAAIKKEPRDVHSRLALADAKLARGDQDVLAKTLADTVQAGGDATMVEEAVDLLEGMTALEPYRIDAREVIRQYEAVGKHLPGTAARVLDYGAVWVRADGSSRMLEHEVVRIQSEEGIKRFSELPKGQGLTLQQRVIKKDGRILEPEFVAEKPTVTMPHLEIGDYVETERIVSSWGDGTGTSYLGPAWFFREENIAYARSEFVVVSPAEKNLIVETRNGVPEPEITRDGPLVVRRWRVDFSPAAPAEPLSPPASEFLPRVAVGWGVDFDERLIRTSRNLVDLTPVDPRIVRIAEGIVEGIPASRKTERAKRLYRWVVDSVEEGEESDGRRVIVGRNGNRWRGYMTLCKALGIETNYVLAKSRLALPPDGPLSEAHQDLIPVLRLEGNEGPIFLTVGDKYAPFGYVPAHVRGQEAYLLLGNDTQAIRVPESGVDDSIRYVGSGKLGMDGSAELDLELRFFGRYAAQIRNALSQIPENQLGNVIESNLLGRSLEGARLKNFEVKDVQDLDKPLILVVDVFVPHLAMRADSRLLISPPFMPTLASFATLSKRATPLLLSEASRQSLELSLELPQGTRVATAPEARSYSYGDLEVAVRDAVTASSLKLDRSVTLAAGRVRPTEYAAFQKFTRQADDALSSTVRIQR